MSLLTCGHINVLNCVGGSPSDGSPIEIVHTFHVFLIVVFDFLATLGMASAIACNLISEKEGTVFFQDLANWEKRKPSLSMLSASFQPKISY